LGGSRKRRKPLRGERYYVENWVKMVGLDKRGEEGRLGGE